MSDEFCKLTGCSKIATNGRGWCKSHYRRWLRYGSPEGSGSALRGEPLAYFQNSVLPYSGDDCLIWPFSRFNTGYAKMFENGKNKNVHRRVCEEVNGPPPTSEHHAAHICGKGQSGCVSPRHLSWKTVTENHADKRTHGTLPSKLTEAQVRNILSLRGIVTQKELADRFNISPSTVGHIQARRSWRWLHG